MSVVTEKALAGKSYIKYLCTCAMLFCLSLVIHAGEAVSQHEERVELTAGVIAVFVLLVSVGVATIVLINLIKGLKSHQLVYIVGATIFSFLLLLGVFVFVCFSIG